MLLGTDTDYIDFTWTKTVHETLPRAGDMAFDIEVCSRGFSGADKAWFGKEELEQFTTDLQALNKTLIGQATLTDLSFGSEGDGFVFEVFNLDRSGHLAARVEMTKPTLVGMKNFAFELSVVIEIDPSMLESFCREWTTLSA